MAIALRSHDVKLSTSVQEFLNSVDKYGKKKLLSLSAAFYLAISSSMVFAAGDLSLTSGRLTDVFETKSFQGSWAVINNSFNWAGGLLNWAISAICFMGLASVIWQRMVSLGYLGARSMFDEVYDIKNEAKGSGVFGMTGIVRNTWQGSRAVGLDAVIRFCYSLLPDLKSYSDFNPDRKAHNLTEDDGPGSYMMKTAMSTIMLIFLFTIGFSGTLSKSYGVIVDGMATAADKLVSVNLESYVRKALNTGESYQFTLGANGTPEGLLAQNIAQDIYSKVLSRMDILDTPTRLQVGKNVEKWVWDNALGSSYGGGSANAGTGTQARGAYGRLEELIKKGSPTVDGDLAAGSLAHSVASPADVSAIKYDVIVNTIENIGGIGEKQGSMDSIGLAAPMLSFINGFDTPADAGIAGQLGQVPLHVHIIFRKTQSSNVNFFIKSDNVNGGATGSP